MFSTGRNQQQSFPELVGQPAQQAAAYIAARGLKPQIIGENDPVTMDYSTGRVRIIVDPSRTHVIKVPTIG